MHQSPTIHFELKFVLTIKNSRNRIAIFPQSLQMKFESFCELFFYSIQRGGRCYTPGSVIAASAVIPIPAN